MALTHEQTQELRTFIDGRRTTLVAELQRGTDRVREDQHEAIAGPAPDPGDESVATLIADLDHADVARDVAELRSLDAACDRMQEGSYGVCADCGIDIPFARLKANPSAERCIDCQSKFEKTYAQPTGTSL
ncbi:MAG TPA: TraR/DksA family transcriptional regulator [Burkholderiales bacterium]|nr:TraR/DksA family transcriptional regulator [Burkholderiales bacterium]